MGEVTPAGNATLVFWYNVCQVLWCSLVASLSAFCDHRSPQPSRDAALDFSEHVLWPTGSVESPCHSGEHMYCAPHTLVYLPAHMQSWKSRRS